MNIKNKNLPNDKIIEQVEINEWIDSLEDVVKNYGEFSAKVILESIENKAKELGIFYDPLPYSPYRNTIPIEEQSLYPGDLQIEEKITAILRWNALVMVMKSNEKYGEVGGHIASYASCAEIFEIGFNHFFKGGAEADLVFYQPHSSPGIYSRAYLEGRLSENQLNNFRHEVKEDGLSSYCHPYLMKKFWNFPTGSMGIGPLNAIYQARFLKYLSNRSLYKSNKHVWGVFGDGEMDEPESFAGLSIASRESLDNLTFIINCNLQRLDGPVRGNGQIIQELESVFKGMGWNVIKVLWGSEWDKIFTMDKKHLLLKQFAQTVDGKYQTLGARDSAYNLKNFFGNDPELLKLVSSLTDNDIDKLKRGGHDFEKLYAAFKLALTTEGKPTVILAKTKKGYGMGKAGESKMIAHQAKKLDFDALKEFRDKFNLPISNEKLTRLDFYRPDENSIEIKYLKQKRKNLGGFIPNREILDIKVETPDIKEHSKFLFEDSDREYSTTNGIIRILGNILKHKVLGPRIVPIVADEARTFGMTNLFSQIGIYSPQGQLYEPEDSSSLLSYKESKNGQLLEEGINEAGALSSWIAAATSYSNHHFPMLPFYIFYSIFGFQRVGDIIWAAADQMPRGFLIGATAGRTSLPGEGLQHQDGQSQLYASTIPNLKSYDPCFASEIAVIFDYGMKQMMERCVNEFYYLTITNEKYKHPKIDLNNKEGIIKGGYLYQDHSNKQININLFGSGSIFRECLKAAEILLEEFNIGSRLYSITSYTELAKQAREVERYNKFNPDSKKKNYMQEMLNNNDPIVACSDYVRGYTQLISTYINNKLYVLGTDGFGRSDTRKNLRNFFEVDSDSIILSSLYALEEIGKLNKNIIKKMIKKYKFQTNSNDPWNI
jgi:pyruvate dehydrogenase E1 component